MDELGESPRDQAARLVAAMRKREDVHGAYRALFASPEGKAVLADLARAGGLLESPMVPGDPYMTAYRVGRRDLVHHILDALRWSETEFLALAEARTSEQIAVARGEAAV